MGQICDAIRQEGIKKGEDSIIVSMLENGYEIEEISKITKKTKEYILSIENKIK